MLIVDEAHATGLYGTRGSGRVEELGLRDRVLATVHTGGKALGSGGAWVAGSRVLRDVLVNRARTFIFSTAPLPVLAAALGAALDLVARRAGAPRRGAPQVAVAPARARRAAAFAPAATSPIVPIIVGIERGRARAAARAGGGGFDVRAIRPPSVAPGTARLRVTVRYPVSDDDLRGSRQQPAVSLPTVLVAPRSVPTP